MRDKSVSAAVGEKICRCVLEHKMLDGASGVLVGFSGGADSTALLHWLSGFCAGRPIRLVAMHINHGIRGEEAERDERFCRSFCESRGIEFVSKKADVPALAARSGKSLEEEARNVRYGLFSEALRELGLDRIATAHNADDNLETVIFNLVRGTGAAGMAGIPPVRGNIIRPLLYCEKEELVAYCRENGLDFVTDSTNSDTSYTRNFIRHEILPRLRQINPAAAQNALRMCRAVRMDDGTLCGLAAEYSLSCGRKRLSELPSSLLSRVLAREFEEFSGGLTLEAAHIEPAEELIRSQRAYFALSLPGKIRLVGDRDALYFEPDPRAAIKREHFSVILSPGINILPRGALLLLPNCAAEPAEYIKEYKNIYKFFIKAFLHSDKINGVLFAEPPRGSARMRVRGMSRTIKNLLGERKLTMAEREKLIMVCDGGGPVWIPGIATRDGCEAQPGEAENLLTLYYFYS